MIGATVLTLWSGFSFFQNKKNWQEISAEIQPPRFTSFICSKCSFLFEIELNPKNQDYFEDVVKQLKDKEEKPVVTHAMDRMDV